MLDHEKTARGEVTSAARSTATATRPVPRSRPRRLASRGEGEDPGIWGGGVGAAILAEIDGLLDGYWAGWDAGDGEAVVARMATGGRFCTPNTPPAGYAAEELAGYVDQYGHLDLTRVGPTIVVSTSVGYEVAGVERVDGYTAAPLWALDHFVVVEEEGRLRIASHRVISTS